MQAVDVLLRADRLDDMVFVEISPRQRQLDQNAMDGGVVVQPVDEGQDLASLVSAGSECWTEWKPISSALRLLPPT